MKELLKPSYYLMMMTLACMGCSIEDVSVNLLSETSNSLQVFQKSVETNLLSVNQTTKRLTFQISCNPFYGSTEVWVGSLETPVTASVESECNLDQQILVSMDLSSHWSDLITNQSISLTIQNKTLQGPSPKKELLAVLGAPVIGEQFARVQDLNGYTNSRVVSFIFSSLFSYEEDQQYPAREVYVTDSAGCLTGGEWKPILSDVQYELPNLNSSNNIYVKFRDGGDNETECLLVVTTHDSVPPTLASFSSSAIDGFFNTDQIHFFQQALGDVFEMKLSSDISCVGGEWVNFSDEILDYDAVVLNQVNVFSLSLRDRAGNISNCLSLTVTHDNVPPGAPTLTMPFTSSPSQNNLIVVRAQNLSYGDIITFYTSGSCSSPVSTHVVSGVEFYFPISFSTNGLYQIHASVQDRAGNTAICVGSLLDYIFDNIPPVGGEFRLTNGQALPAGSDGRSLFNVNVLYPPDVTLYQYKVGSGDGLSECGLSAGYTSFTSVSVNPIVLDLSAFGDGPVFVCLKLQDGAGNIQTGFTRYTWPKVTSSPLAVITNTPPNPSNQTLLNVDIEDTEMAEYRYKLGEAVSTDCSVASGYSAFRSVTQNITDTISSLSDGLIRLCVVGKSALNGNEQPFSLATHAEWVKDTLAPQMSMVTPPVSGTYYMGQKVAILLDFNESIMWNANSSLTFQFGGVTYEAQYDKLISDTQAQYVYTLNGTETGSFSTGIIIGVSSNGFRDLAGNNLSSLVNPPPVTAPATLASNIVSTFSFELPRIDVVEGDTTQKLRIIATPSPPVDVTLEIISQGESGVDSLDYSAPSRFVTFPANSTQLDLDINPANDGLSEGIERVVNHLRGTSFGNLSNNWNEIFIHDEPMTLSRISVGELKSIPNSVCYLANYIPVIGGQVYCFGSIPIPSVQYQNSYARMYLTGVKRLLNAGSNYFAEFEDGSWQSWGSGTYQTINLGANVSDILRVGATSSSTTAFCAIYLDSTVKCWGSGTFNSIGYNVLDPLANSDLNGLKQVTPASSISGAVCALGDFDLNPLTLDTIKCWGYNANGTLGNNSLVNSFTPQDVIGSAGSKDLIGFSNFGFCALGRFDHLLMDKVKCWGKNPSGQPFYVSNQAAEAVTVPTFKSDLDGAIKIVSSSSTRGCALGDFNPLTAGNEVKCWGNSSNGLFLNSSIPSQYESVLMVALGHNIQDLFGVGTGYCILTSLDQFLCWGYFSSTTPLQPFENINWDAYQVTGGRLCVANAISSLCYSGSTVASNTITYPANTIPSETASCVTLGSQVHCSNSFRVPSGNNTNIDSARFLGLAATNISNAGANFIKYSSQDYWYYGDQYTQIPSQNELHGNNSNRYCFIENQILKCFGGTSSSNFPAIDVDVIEVSIPYSSSSISFQMCYIKNSQLYCGSTSTFNASLVSTPSAVKGLTLSLSHLCVTGVINNQDRVLCRAHRNAASSVSYSQLGNGQTTLPNPWDSWVEVILPIVAIDKLESRANVTCASDPANNILCWGFTPGGLPTLIEAGGISKWLLKSEFCYLRTNKEFWCSSAGNPNAGKTKIADNVDDFWMNGVTRCYKTGTPTNQVLCNSTSDQVGEVYDVLFDSILSGWRRVY